MDALLSRTVSREGLPSFCYGNGCASHRPSLAQISQQTNSKTSLHQLHWGTISSFLDGTISFRKKTVYCAREERKHLVLIRSWNGGGTFANDVKGLEPSKVSECLWRYSLKRQRRGTLSSTTAQKDTNSERMPHINMEGHDGTKEEMEDKDEDEEEEEEEEVEKDRAEDPKEELESFPDDGGCHSLVSAIKERNPDFDEKDALPREDVWWHLRDPPPGTHVWSAHQKRMGEPDLTMATIMAQTGQIKIFGEIPSIAETSLARARRFVFYEERIQAEEARRAEIGPMAYYQEWVKAWKKDTSWEAVLKHYEETEEDVAMQLMDMLSHQTQEEYRMMMGTDIRIKRDPLVMRATDDQKKSVYGGDPVYPTINYIQDPNCTIDYRGPNYHEPTPTIIERLKKSGRMITQAEHDLRIQQEEEDNQEVEVGYSVVGAIDIGDKDDVEDEVDEDVEDDTGDHDDEIEELEVTTDLADDA